MRRGRATIVAVEKQRVLHNLSVCICSLRYPACNAHAPYCHLWPAPLYNTFSTFSHKRHDFRKKLLKIKCSDFLHNFFILGRNERHRIENVYWSSCKVPFILVRYQRNLGFLNRFSKNTQIWNLMKMRPVGVEFFHTDKHEANSRFSQFCERT